MMSVEAREGKMLLLVVMAMLAMFAGYCGTEAQPVQSMEKRIFCNVIGCVSKRSGEGSSSMDAFDEDDGVVPLKKDLSAENLLSRANLSPSSVRQQIRQAWLANQNQAHNHRGHPIARGRQGPGSVDLSFWRELQANTWPHHATHRIRRDDRHVRALHQARKQLNEV